MLAPRPSIAPDYLNEWGRSDVAAIAEQLNDIPVSGFRRRAGELQVIWDVRRDNDYDRLAIHLMLGSRAATLSVGHAHQEEGIHEVASLVIGQPPLADVLYQRNPLQPREKERVIGLESAPSFLVVANHAVEQIIRRP